MKVFVKIYPVAGLNDMTHEVDIELTEGNLSELLARIKEHLSVDLNESAVMLLINGRGHNMDKELSFNEGDAIWLLPKLSGG